MIEVTENDGHACTDLAKGIGDGHFNIVERDIGSTGSRRISCLDLLCRDAGTTGNKNNCESRLPNQRLQAALPAGSVMLTFVLQPVVK